MPRSRPLTEEEERELHYEMEREAWESYDTYDPEIGIRREIRRLIDDFLSNEL